MSVIDTPGICTNLRPEHDEISKNAIANSDLLVYIVTCELFDDFIGNKFRELLIDEKKADETILVVNKMAKVGNTEEMRNNKLCDLAKVTTPYKPEELHTVFIDAQSYLDSCSETDPKMKQALEKRGNFSALIDVLNKFAADNNKLSGKLTTPLYVLRNRIDAAISEMHAQDSDNETAERENELIRKNETLSNFKAELWDSVKIIREEIIDKINEQIDDIDTDGKQPEEVQRMVQEAVSSIVLIIDCFRGKVGEKIKDLEYDLEYDYEELSIDDLDSLDNVPNEQREFALPKEIHKESRASAVLQNKDKIAEAVTYVKDIAPKEMMYVKKGGIKGLWSSVWGGDKYSKELSTFGRLANNAAALTTLGIELYEGSEEKRREKELAQRNKEIREKVRAYFEKLKQDFENDCEKIV